MNGKSGEAYFQARPLEVTLCPENILKGRIKLLQLDNDMRKQLRRISMKIKKLMRKSLQFYFLKIKQYSRQNFADCLRQLRNNTIYQSTRCNMWKCENPNDATNEDKDFESFDGRILETLKSWSFFL